MAYGQLRFLQNNFVTAASMITPASQADGFVGGCGRVQGSGSATMYAIGAFTGPVDVQIIVKIDSIDDGQGIGAATYAWKYATTGGWDAMGQLTSEALIDIGSYGIKIAFVAGETGNDFEGDEVWHFEARATYGVGNLISLDRNRIFQSGAMQSEATSIVFNLGSAKAVSAFALLDHNLTAANSTLTLQAHTSDSWGAPSYSQVVTVTEAVILYLSQTYQYWRVLVHDATIGHIEASKIFLGTYTALIVSNSDWGTPRTYGLKIISQESDSGVLRRKVYAKQAKLTLSFGKVLRNTDVETLLALRDALYSVTTGIISPVLVHLFFDETDSLLLMDWVNIDSFVRTYESYLRNSVTMELVEQVKLR